MSHGTDTLTRLGLVRRYPVDLAAVSLGAMAAYWTVTSFPAGSAPRLVATGLLALFFPGYALVSVLFPASERRAREATTPIESRPRGIDAVERLGLSFALSLAIVPIVAIVLPVTQWGFDTGSTAVAFGAITVGCAQLGVVRRLRTPESERFTVAPIASIARLRGDDAAVTVSSVVLVLAIGAAIGALLVGFLVPPATGGFTELALYGENEDGELVAGAIDDEVAPGESLSATVSIENHEGEDRSYAVVVQEQRLENGEVVDRTRLDALEVAVAAGATETRDLRVAPTASDGETVRISVLLYDEVPTEPTNENAMEDTYVWVTVEE